MSYTRNSPIQGTGVASAEAIQAWFVKNAARGASWVGLPVAPIPADLGVSIVRSAGRYGFNSDEGAAQIAHETAFGQSRIFRDKLNPAGIGAENDDPYRKALTYTTVGDGCDAWAAHLAGYVLGDGPWNALSPRYAIVKANGWAGIVRVLADLEQRWAWTPQAQYDATPLDQRYGAKVAALANDLVDFANNQTWEPPMGDTPKVALAAGHRNSSGGDAIEKEQTAQLTPLLAAALRRYGMNVRVITPDEGRGIYPGGLDAVASQVRADDDLFIEVHTEGNDAGDAGRGVFVVYPDWDDDVDADARDTLGPSIAKRVSSASGMPVRGKGVMSEKDTGVGRDGYRLGVFRVTAPLRANTTRMIVEYGSHSSPADMARWRTPGVVQAMADATADAVARFFEVDTATPVTPVQPAPAPDPNALYIPQTDKWIVNQGVYKMLDAWREFGGLEGCGWPLDGMTGDGRDDGGVEQLFENVLIEIDSQGNARRGGLGQRYERALKRLQELEAA